MVFFISHKRNAEVSSERIDPAIDIKDQTPSIFLSASLNILAWS